MITGLSASHEDSGWIVTPTRRRELATPIDSRTLTTSRTTVRETPYRASICSMENTSPAARRPVVRSAPMRVRTLWCRPPPCALVMRRIVSDPMAHLQRKG